MDWVGEKLIELLLTFEAESDNINLHKALEAFAQD
jgi:hypothetical protein